MTLRAHASLLATSLLMIACQDPVARGQSFDLSWHTIDGGGATTSSGGAYTLGGSIGQPDAGEVLTGGPFELTGGFWLATQVTPPPCPGDLNGDRRVDLTDLATLLGNFGDASGAALADGDLDNDSDVDLSDLTTLLAHFGSTCP